MTENALGIYEKALPQSLTWEEKFNLVHDLGFNFIEFSIDESDERLARLDWTREERQEFRDAMWKTNSRINTMMLSGHRRYPLGSKDPVIRQKSLEMMQKAIDLAVDLGIRNIQMATTFFMKKKRLTVVSYLLKILRNVLKWQQRKW